MTEDIQPKKSFFKDKKEQLKNWFNDDEAIEYNLSFEEVIKSFFVIIPVHAILYLYQYYSNFGTHYFLYFNPVDFLNVFYANNITFLITAVSFAIIFIHLVINFEARAFFKAKANHILITVYLIVVLLAIVYALITHFNKFSNFLSMSFLVFVIALKYKETRILYYALVICYFLYTMHLAKENALIVKTTKPNFTILLNDNSYALKQDTLNRKDYFIGKVTDYIFVYSDSIKAVRVIPVSDIKEIQFPLGK